MKKIIYLIMISLINVSFGSSLGKKIISNCIYCIKEIIPSIDTKPTINNMDKAINKVTKETENAKPEIQLKNTLSVPVDRIEKQIELSLKKSIPSLYYNRYLLAYKFSYYLQKNLLLALNLPLSEFIFFEENKSTKKIKGELLPKSEEKIEKIIFDYEKILETDIIEDFKKFYIKDLAGTFKTDHLLILYQVSDMIDTYFQLEGLLINPLLIKYIFHLSQSSTEDLKIALQDIKKLYTSKTKNNNQKIILAIMLAAIIIKLLIIENNLIIAKNEIHHKTEILLQEEENSIKEYVPRSSYIEIIKKILIDIENRRDQIKNLINKVIPYQDINNNINSIDKGIENLLESIKNFQEEQSNQVKKILYKEREKSKTISEKIVDDLIKFYSIYLIIISGKSAFKYYPNIKEIHIKEYNSIINNTVIASYPINNCFLKLLIMIFNNNNNNIKIFKTSTIPKKNIKISRELMEELL